MGGLGARRAARRASYGEGFVFSLLSVGSSAVLGLATTILIARLYGVKVVGEYALAYAPTGVVWFLSTLREQPALVRELAKLQPRDPLVTGLFAATFAFSSGLTVIVAVLVMVGSSFVIKGPIGDPGILLPAIAILGGYVVVTNTGWNIDSVLAAFRAGRQLFWLRLHQAVVYLGLVVAGSYLFGDIWGLVMAMNVSFATALLHRLVWLHRWIRLRVPRSAIREGFKTLPAMLKFGAKMTPGFIANGVSNQAGTWILGIASSVVAVGAYNRAQMLGQRLVQVNSAVTEMLFPTLVERRHGGDDAGFDRALVDSLRYVAILMLLPAAAGGGAAFGVMELFGPGFTRASDALALVLATPALTTMSNLQSHALFAVDRPIASTMVGIVRMVVTVAASAVLVVAMGITGAALGIVIGSVVDILLKVAMMQRHMTSSMRALWPLRQVAALALAYGAGFVASRVVFDSLPHGPGLVAGLAAGCVAYAVALLALRGVNERDRRRLTAAVDRVLAKRRGGPPMVAGAGAGAGAPSSN